MCPDGKAAYPSSVLMNAIPAKVAGVAEVIMVVPTPDGVVNDMVLAAAAIAGVDRVFTIGGAQAVAALAYGTDTVPAVDKIVGPGNIFVATAKREVFGTVGIDMIAGPSEILVICDGQTHPDWIAMDLFSQAEHDEQAQSILISPSAEFLDAVEASIERLLPTMERAEIIRTSLADRAALIQVANLAVSGQGIKSNCAGVIWNCLLLIRTRCCRTSAMPVLSLWAGIPPKPLGTIVPAQITCCLLAVPHVFHHLWVSTISRSAHPLSDLVPKVRAAWGEWLPCWPEARA